MKALLNCLFLAATLTLLSTQAVAQSIERADLHELDRLIQEGHDLEHSLVEEMVLSASTERELTAVDVKELTACARAILCAFCAGRPFDPACIGFFALNYKWCTNPRNSVKNRCKKEK